MWPETASGTSDTLEAAPSSDTSTTTNPSAPTTISPITAPNAAAGTTDLSATSPSVTAGAGVAPVGQPSGAGVFSRTPLIIDISLNGGYDNNVTNSSNTSSNSGSEYTSGNLALSYTFGEPRLQLTLNSAFGGTYYYSTVSSQNYDVNLTTTFRINYKATPRLSFTTSILAAYLTEPSFNFGVGVVSRSGNYFYTSDQLTADFAWMPRLSTLTRYNVAVVKYEESAVGASQDRIDNTFSNEFRFLATPITTLVGEYRYEVVSYDQMASLDSTTNFLLGGFDHTFSPHASVTFRGGDQFRSFTQGGSQSGPYFEGNLNYKVGRRTSISWANWYGIGEPNVTSANAQSRTSFHTGLEGNFNLTPRIGSTLSFYYEHSDYSSFGPGGGLSPSFTQDSIDVGLSLRYAITRMLRIQAGYHRTELTSSGVGGQNYSRSSIFAGVNLTF
jgi:Putative beta-barrel porin 2